MLSGFVLQAIPEPGAAPDGVPEHHGVRGNTYLTGGRRSAGGENVMMLPGRNGVPE